MLKYNLLLHELPRPVCRINQAGIYVGVENSITKLIGTSAPLVEFIEPKYLEDEFNKSAGEYKGGKNFVGGEGTINLPEVQNLREIKF